MRRSTLAEVLAPAAVDREGAGRHGAARNEACQEEADRSAAIAAMGYRLAAAGPRTRQRLLDRQSAQEQNEHEDWDGYRASDVTDNLHGFAEAPGQYSLEFGCPDAFLPEPEPRLSARTIIRRSAVLGVMAACGFGFVLFGYGREGVHVHHRAAHADTGEAAAPPQPGTQEQAEAPVVTATLQEAALVQPATSETTTLLDPPPATVPAQARIQTEARDQTSPAATVQATTAAAPPAPRQAPPKQEAPASPKLPVRQTALAEAAPPVHPHFHPPTLRAMPVLFRPADIKPHIVHPVVTARIELPRWLTEDHHPEHPHVALVMSEPPHDLLAPAVQKHQAAAQPKPEAQASPQPAPREPDTITASSADVAPQPYRPPPLRPGYGAPYPGYGPYYPPYGGYYGAAMAYAAPYPAPPGYGYGYRW